MDRSYCEIRLVKVVREADRQSALLTTTATPAVTTNVTISDMPC